MVSQYDPRVNGMYMAGQNQFYGQPQQMLPFGGQSPMGQMQPFGGYNQFNQPMQNVSQLFGIAKR